MPLPKPKDNETDDEFLDRCMSDDTMVEEYPDNDQRYAVCQSLLENEDDGDDEEAASVEISTIERRCIAADRGAEVRMEQREDGEEIIRGTAAVYYDGTKQTEFELFPGMVERIMPGAFDEALEGSPDVVGLFNHNADNVLGRTTNDTLELADDDRGLGYRIKPAQTSTAQDVVELLRREDIYGSSFAFTVSSDEWHLEDGLDVREIREIGALFDVGPVTYPAYKATDAKVAQRMLEQYRTEREDEPPRRPGEQERDERGKSETDEEDRNTGSDATAEGENADDDAGADERREWLERHRAQSKRDDLDWYLLKRDLQ